MAMILLIDDDGFYRGVIRPILEDDGHQVIEASNGAEGLEIYRMRRPALVITDMRMPGVGGTEVIKSLREIDPHGSGSNLTFGARRCSLSL